MKSLRAVAVLAILFFACAAFAEEKEIVSAIDGCPTMTHMPVFETLRGVPVILEATVECEVGSVNEVFLQFRLTDLGKPKAFKMKDEGNGRYKANVPVSMIEGLSRFWYYIDADGLSTNGEPTRVQTAWHVVNILDPNRPAGGALYPTKERGFFWLAGGVAAFGGALIVDNNTHNHNAQPVGTSVSSSGGGDEGARPRRSRNSLPPSSGRIPQVDPPPPPPPPPSPCDLTPMVAFVNTSPCESGAIEVNVCGVCPGAGISVITSWGEHDSAIASSEVACGVNPSIKLTVKKPDDGSGGVGGFSAEGRRRRNLGSTPPESEWIQVWVGSDLVKQIAWPSPSEYADCEDLNG